MDVLRLYDASRRPASWTDIIRPGRLLCSRSVLRIPSVRFDVFDHEGRAQSPLLTVVHPSQRESMEGSATELRWRNRIAMALLAGGVPLMLFAYSISGERHPILPGFVGLNMVLIALRLLWMNLASREVERNRVARLAQRGAAPEPARAPISPYKPEDPR